MTKIPNLSILIITYNRAIDTLLLLKNLAEQYDVNQYVGEILVLNNNSTENYGAIEDFANTTTLPLQYINHHENLGVARGRNYLIDKATFPYLLVLDDDVEFKNNDAIAQISKLFDKPQYIENKTAIITLNIHYFDTKERQKNALPHKKYEIYKDKDWFLTYYFTGAAHLMKTAIIKKAGPYPSNFFYGMEEYYMAYNVINMGYTLAYDSDVMVLHKESPLGRLPNREKVKMMWYNKCVVVWRSLPKKYFYTTAFMWVLFYLKNSGFDILGAFKNLKKVLSIPNEYSRSPLDATALAYMKKVEARLWY